MGKYVPYAISYANNGLVRNKNAFALTDDSFQELENAYQWRGRIKKKQPHGTLGRLERSITAVSFTGAVDQTDTTFNIFTNLGLSEPNASVVPGDETTITVTFGADTLTDSVGTGTMTVTGGANVSAATINYSTGDITVTPVGAYSVTPVVTLNYYPGLPVMGLLTRERDETNDEEMIAFDTKYSYTYSSVTRRFSLLSEATSPITTWTGSDSEFFSAANYWSDSNGNKLFWVTNFNEDDPIRYYNGTDWSRGATLFEPYLSLSTGPDPERLYQARVIIPYKGRLVMLNTWEGPTSTGRPGTQYPNRARWSQNGDPTDLTDAWRTDIQGRGGYVDAPTTEHIIGAEYIRDQLVVMFERSTWLLRYTGNAVLPFVWERINRELGADSTFSMVNFDDGILYIGDKSINACTGTSVQRIDEEIPDQVFQIHNANDGPKRVHGVRDFFEKTVYWTFPSQVSNQTYPDRVLLFNYDAKSWATWKDSFTCFGTYQQNDDRTWADLKGTKWYQANFPWNDPSIQSDFPSIAAGNQQGYVFTVQQLYNEGDTDLSAQSLHIQAITAGTPGQLTVIDHNLEEGDFILLSDIKGSDPRLNNGIFKVDQVVDSDTIEISSPPINTITGISQATQAVVTVTQNWSVGDRVYFRAVQGMTEINGLVGRITAQTATTITVDIDTSGFTAYSPSGYVTNTEGDFSSVDITGTYIGAGQITRVDNFRVKSKAFNMIDQGSKNFLGHIDFLCNVTDDGEFKCDVYADYDQSSPVNTGDDGFFNTVVPTTVSNFGMQNKDKEWQRFFCPVDAQFFTFEMLFSDAQMANPLISGSEIEIDAFIIWSEKGGRIVE